VAREHELLAAHGKKWLGELARLVMADYRFERGFLASCRIDDSKRAAATATANNPIWSTVHTHDGPLELALSPVMKSLRTITYSHREEDDPDDADYDAAKPPAWHALLVVRTWPFEHLTYSSADHRRDLAIAALAECKTLPSLRTLIMHDAPDDVAPLFDAPVLKRLETFGLRFDPYHNRGWAKRIAPLLAKAPVRRLTIELLNSSYPTRIVLARPARAYTEADVDIAPTSRSAEWNIELVDELLAILKTLPKLERLNIAARRGSDAKALDHLARAVKRLGIEAVAIA
jgi:hypothetical protein